jgi:hypothetical protein
VLGLLLPRRAQALLRHRLLRRLARLLVLVLGRAAAAAAGDGARSVLRRGRDEGVVDVVLGGRAVARLVYAVGATVDREVLDPYLALLDLALVLLEVGPLRTTISPLQCAAGIAYL